MSQLRIKNEKAKRDKNRLASLIAKHKGKSEKQIKNADVLEWAKKKMMEELRIES